MSGSDNASAWVVGLGFSATISVTFLAIALMLFLGLTRTKQWRNNPLAVATFMLYLTCGGGHAVHTLQLAEPTWGATTAAAAAARVEFGDWHMWLADGVTAAAGVWYWTMRKKFPELVTGAAVYEDLRVRQSEALEIHDNVVQGLAKAKMALELDQNAEGERAVADALESSKRIISDLLGRDEIRPGDLRRGP